MNLQGFGLLYAVKKAGAEEGTNAEHTYHPSAFFCSASF
jgi:hypothetical protein